MSIVCTCKEAYRIEEIKNLTFDPTAWDSSDDYEDFYSALVTSNITTYNSVWYDASNSTKIRVILLAAVALLSIPLNFLIILVTLNQRNQRPTSSWLLFNVCIGMTLFTFN